MMTERNKKAGMTGYNNCRRGKGERRYRSNLNNGV